MARPRSVRYRGLGRRMRFRAHLAAASTLVALAVWSSSGTMAPYAATWAYPIVTEPCGYLVNSDHHQHEAVFEMLDGQPPERWRQSLVLRRLLFPLVAYPFMKAAGYQLGGFLASLLCQLAGLWALALHLRRRQGESAAIAGMWMLAVYPGITYWAALPYAYVAIVPASIGLFILLTRLEERRGIRAAAGISVAMGLLFTAYDLAPFFGVAALIILLRGRRWADLPVAIAGMALGPVCSLLLLKLALHAPLANSNTALYGTVLGAYLHPPAAGVWLRSVTDFPLVLVRNFFVSNMVFLPAAFLVTAALTRRRPTLVEGSVMAAVALVFLFNNLAPPYGGRWQMRGGFIPRLYQPIFVALIVYCARAVGDRRSYSRAKGALLVVTAALACAVNASIAFGPIGRVPWAGGVYQAFYQHAPPGTMEATLARYGRRPLGFFRRP
jgi:hypothetical protein